MSVQEACNYVAVDAQISTAGMISEEQLNSLRAEGYEAVINLLPTNSEYALASERAIVEGQDVHYRQIGVDFNAPTVENFADFCAAMSDYSGQKILVHCAVNYRASAFYALYANRHRGWSQQQARAFMESIWQPSEFPAWQRLIGELLR